MIEKYCKKSAEILGFIVVNKKRNTFFITEKSPCSSQNWKPDKDANQREMIEDWLIKQKLAIRYDISESGTSVAIEKYEDDMMIGYYTNNGVNESTSLAFMEAFMEYIKQKNNE